MRPAVKIAKFTLLHTSDRLPAQLETFFVEEIHSDL